jgi:asparagine synthase (glutamine-hydrolysing)
MCGIAGIVDWGAGPADARETMLARMLELIAHRGPDEAGIFLDESVAIGAVRLQVVDFSGGGQPMSDPSGRWWIAYNGEIYNYPELRRELSDLGATFRSTSDTEVALQAWIRWGPEAAARFEGGFAIAIYDRAARRLHLVRDRLGKRPLYYRQGRDCVLFASEMKAFLADRRSPLAWDVDAIAGLFGRWTLIDGETPFLGVRQVSEGAVVEIDPHGLREIMRIPMMPPAAPSQLTFEAAAAQANSLLHGAVRRRLRGDAKIGVTVSGGLDSAIVAHLARQELGESLPAFSIGFASEDYDESAEQRLLADHLGLQLHHRLVRDGDIAEAFRDATFHAEVPQFRTALAPMYLLFRDIAESGVKVVLSGEGADEVFLGYDIFKETRLRARWSELTETERREQLSKLYPYLGHFSDRDSGALAAVFARSSTGVDNPLFSHALRFDNGAFARRLLAGAPAAGDRLAALADRAGLTRLDPVSRAQWLEMHTLLTGYLLSSQGERMSFAHGCEPRNPFLAPDLIAFAASLPEEFHLGADGTEKRLLRHAFRHALPPAILGRRKQPYRAPGVTAFRAGPGRFSPWVEELLSPAAVAAAGLLDPPRTERLVAALRIEERPVSPREDQAFALILSLSQLDRQFIRGDLPGRAATPAMRTTRPVEAA